MKLLVILVILWQSFATPLPSVVSTTTARSPVQIGETIKQLTNQLMETNDTSPEIVTLDTRTPPKIKQHARKKNKQPGPIENSHAGIAIPVNEDEIILEEATKKLNFYKIEKPTTNGGLSTWILLSEQTTPKPSRKAVIKPIDHRNTTLLVETKTVKPIFKKRSTTAIPASTTKLTKVKASILNDIKKIKVNETTTVSSTTVSTSTTTLNSSYLPLEAKETETELIDVKKTRRPSSNKRKKNKNRRKRPIDKSDKPIKSIEKPIGTQLYNYLSREVMPTVGVGLVGLMVTAGLAGYFLYPFGIARRSYEIDRRVDKDRYYYDEYSGGIAEEEAIGKVIAGMPSNGLYGNNFKTPTSRHSFANRRVIEQSTVFNVGEEVTPAAVPEHGPRNLRVRRQLPEENEIDGIISSTESFHSTSYKPDKVKSFIDTLKDLFHLKVYLGLQLLQNATQAVSKYVTHVQRQLDQQYYNKTI